MMDDEPPDDDDAPTEVPDDDDTPSKARDDGSLPAVRLVPATGSAIEWIHGLLDEAGLPTADLGGADRAADDDGPALYVVVAADPEAAPSTADDEDGDGGGDGDAADDGGGAGGDHGDRGGDAPGRVGCIGIEPYDDAGLLRSAAVVPSARGRGYGAAAVRALEAEARAAELDALYLLTTTAAAFFERLGYERVDRDAVPESVASSAEFAELCPDSATVMCRRL